VEASRISTSGVGPDQPIASNSTAEGKAQNRRVTITLSPTQV
jgi:Outer membrane protein and related peptidoglycan-associated (lipo)proteins